MPLFPDDKTLRDIRAHALHEAVALAIGTHWHDRKSEPGYVLDAAEQFYAWLGDGTRTTPTETTED